MKQPKIQRQISLANFTTWKVGGPAEWFAEPNDVNDIKELISWSKEHNLSCQIIGAGSNLLINDTLLKGLTICTKKLQGAKIDVETGLIDAQGGEPIPVLARRAAKAGLHGLEWAVGIPGTIGGAAVMNAGAQGNCTANRLVSLTAISLSGGEPFELTNKELKFDYRQSLLQQEELMVLSVRFKLDPGHDRQELSRITTENLNHRLKTQPYNLPSCGSVFRNPEPQKAGKIIEKLGLKGIRIGGAEVSKTHANFIVNSGSASAIDISRLITLIQEKVEDSHGLLLQTEVKRLGFESIH